jgi:hypothetical protein
MQNIDAIRRKSWFTKCPEPIHSYEFSKSNVFPLFIKLIISLVILWRKPDRRGIISTPNPGKSFLLDHSGISFYYEGGWKEVLEIEGLYNLYFNWRDIPP